MSPASRPSITLCEWMTGTTISKVLGQIPEEPQPPRQRNVVRVEVTTDDESEEDSVKITYPRTGRTVLSQKALGTAVKKVRFRDPPRKSALKKPVNASSTEETSPSESDVTETSESAASTGNSESTDASTNKPTKKENKNKKKADMPQATLDDSNDSSSSFDVVMTPSSSEVDSDVDSEAHPTCDCMDCVRARIKKNKQDTKAKAEKHKKPKKGPKETVVLDTSGSESDDENSASDSDKSKASPKKGKDGTKQKPKTGDKNGKKQHNTSANNNNGKKDKSNKDQADEDKTEPTSTQAGKKNKNKQSNKKNQVSEEKQKKKNQGPENSDDGQAKKTENIAKDKPVKRGKRLSARGSRASYPEANPLPHHRRPQLIEPIRAEVVQTERVIESPEDPLPNAYYDSANNIIRVYHGPVYGSHGQRPLYPKRDMSQRPLSIGMPHPTQNPYYNGFSNRQWDVNGPPAGFQPNPDPGMNGNDFVMSGANYGQQWPTNGPPGTFQAHSNPGMNGHGNGFHTNVRNDDGTTSSSKKDVDGVNNVGPDGIKSVHDNPYIPKRTRSTFSQYGSNSQHSASGSQRGAETGGWNSFNNGAPSNEGKDAGGSNNNDWNQADGNNGNGDQNTWRDSNDRGATWGEGNDYDATWGGGNGSGDQGHSSWDNTQHNNGGDGRNDSNWDHNTSQTNEGTWDDGTHSRGYNNGAFANRNFDNPHRSGSESKPWNNDRPAENGSQRRRRASLVTSPVPDTSSNICPSMPGTFPKTTADEVSPRWGNQGLAVDTHGKIEEWERQDQQEQTGQW